MSDGSARVRRFIERQGLLGEFVESERSTKTAAEAAEALGCELGQVVKSLVVVIDDGRPVLLLVAGDRRADLDASLGRFKTVCPAGGSASSMVRIGLDSLLRSTGGTLATIAES